jgi:hypothetical protein
MRRINPKNRFLCLDSFRIAIAVVSISTNFSLGDDLKLDDLLYNNWIGKDSKEILSLLEIESGRIDEDGWQTIASLSFESEKFEISIEMHQNKCVAISVTRGQLPLSSDSRELFEKLANELRERFGEAPLLDLNKFIQQEDATETPGYTWVNDTRTLGLQYSICPYGTSILMGLDDKQYKLKEIGSIPREMGNLETIFNKHSGKLPSDWNAARKLWDAKQDAGLLEETSRDAQETASHTANADSPSSIVSAKPEIVATSNGDPARFRLLPLTAIGISGLLMITGFLLIRFRFRKQ